MEIASTATAEVDRQLYEFKVTCFLLFCAILLSRVCGIEHYRHSKVSLYLAYCSISILYSKPDKAVVPVEMTIRMVNHFGSGETQEIRMPTLLANCE